MGRGEAPIDRTAGPLAEFAAGLRALRQQAGSPPYRRLAREARYSASTLCHAAGGRGLPSLKVTLAYVRACGGEQQDWERRWRVLNAAVNPARGVSDECTTAKVNPRSSGDCRLDPVPSGRAQSLS